MQISVGEIVLIKVNNNPVNRTQNIRHCLYQNGHQNPTKTGIYCHCDLPTFIMQTFVKSHICDVEFVIDQKQAIRMRPRKMRINCTQHKYIEINIK